MPRKRGVAPYERDLFQGWRLPGAPPPLGAAEQKMEAAEPATPMRRGKEEVLMDSKVPAQSGAETGLFDMVRSERDMATSDRHALRIRVPGAAQHEALAE